MDASTVNMLNRFASHAVAVLRELNMRGTVVSRRPPSMLWVVQNFNSFNLANSQMSVEQLHEMLQASGGGGEADSLPPAAAKLLGGPGRGMRRGLLASLFASQHLLPVRRPHSSDEVVANLHKHASAELRADYLSDASKLQELATRLVLPAHICGRNESAAAARSCVTHHLDGPAFVAMLERWVALGHITVEEGDGTRRINATRLIESCACAHPTCHTDSVILTSPRPPLFQPLPPLHPCSTPSPPLLHPYFTPLAASADSTQFDAWMKWRCNELRQILERSARKLNGKGCPVKGCPRISAKLNEKLQNLEKAAISHMVDRKECACAKRLHERPQRSGAERYRAHCSGSCIHACF